MLVKYEVIMLHWNWMILAFYLGMGIGICITALFSVGKEK